MVERQRRVGEGWGKGVYNVNKGKKCEKRKMWWGRGQQGKRERAIRFMSLPLPCFTLAIYQEGHLPCHICLPTGRVCALLLYHSEVWKMLTVPSPAKHHAM